MTVETDPTPDADLFAAAREAVQTLQDAGVPTEVLAILHPSRRKLFIRRDPYFERLDDVWRIGRLLLSTRAALFCHGRTTRAAKRERLGLQSQSQEERRDIAGYAFASGFPAGTEVNFHATPLPLSRRLLATEEWRAGDWPLAVVGDELRVRWRTGADAASSPEFGAYLRDRVGLMIEPPGTAGSW
ncbi:MAG: hypothetical protein ACTJFR_03385 [Canibacter sp.]